MMVHKALTWSLMSPIPVLFYVKQTDCYGVAWNGLLMGHKQAMQIAAYIAFNIAPTPRARQLSLNEFHRLHMSGGFGEQPWATGVDNWHYLSNKLVHGEFAKSMQVSPARFFEIFSKENALVD
ncbi:hypothetical protein UFOVP116_272 [uncultured Caudovirales phage]|uniref:Uncharacterized protein n=1 Tax=uncultured Caudovirales phage TaxID=2100421 RepID=A0A6J5L7W8_9CAUD|nr:hypothetical protein UFOVP116_272 [uncultured Caudovirales phage]